MHIEKGTLFLTDSDCEHIYGDIEDGQTPIQALENQLFLSGYKLKDVYSLDINKNYRIAA